MFRWRRKKVLTLEAAICSGDPKEIRKTILSYLRNERKWYHLRSAALKWAWNCATFFIVVLGALTSILTAARLGEYYHTLLIVLPAVSSLLGALLIQFKLRDLWHLREIGRITVEELICEAQLITQDEAAKTAEHAVKIRLKVHQLEREQLDRFFSERTP